jgi:hypothetical protein
VALKEDYRPIMGVYFPEDCSNGYTVGREGVTRIDVAMENGQYEAVPWFEIYIGEKIVARLNAAFITQVTY